jgi:hypothetical protein
MRDRAPDDLNLGPILKVRLNRFWTLLTVILRKVLDAIVDLNSPGTHFQ